MKRLLTGLVALTLFAGPASAQTAEEIAAAGALSRADVVAQCTTAPDACAALLRAYIAAQPPAARVALQNDIVAELAQSGVSVEIAAPAGATTGSTTPAGTDPVVNDGPNSSGDSLSEGGEDDEPTPSVPGSPS